MIILESETVPRSAFIKVCGRTNNLGCQTMYERSRMKSEKRAAWLMALGRELRDQYDERMGPPSPRLAALFEQAEIAVQPGTRATSPASDT